MKEQDVLFEDETESKETEPMTQQTIISQHVRLENQGDEYTARRHYSNDSTRENVCMERQSNIFRRKWMHPKM